LIWIKRLMASVGSVFPVRFERPAVNAALPLNPEHIVGVAVEAARRGGDMLAAVLDRIPAAVYLTDADGLVTHFNRACADFAGRQPEAMRDRWCVTLRLYDDAGTYLPHEKCPMAVAVREGRRVRGVRATAERPDGTRVDFLPHPTPIFDQEERLTGAVNLLVDTGDARYRDYLRGQSARCRRLASAVGDTRTTEILQAMASDYDEQVRVAERPEPARAR
jgi:PAS domain S-box-containing protein